MGLYILHNHAIAHNSSFLSNNMIAFDRETFDLMKKKERSLLLGLLYDLQSDAVFEVKREFHELKREFEPSPIIAFPDKEPFILHDGSYTPQPEPLTFLATTQTSNIPLWDHENTLYHAPVIINDDFPLMTDLMTEKESYEGLDALAGSDHFDVSVEYSPRLNKPGYLFKVTFMPKKDVLFKRIAQNYYFLIDRSNSISRSRFALNKEIVLKAVDYLKPQDKFNILFFDNKVYKLSDKSLEWNQENVQKARRFLEQQTHGGYFAATELYSSLSKIIPKDVSNQEVNTAILLSDGDTYLPQEKQRLTIGEWTAKNQGKVALYAIASGDGNNLPLLDLISNFNKGSLVYAYDHHQLPDRLSELMLAIRNPIGKSMIATTICPDKQALITLYPKNKRMPDLYQNRSFVLYGSINKLSDFVLFLQGKYYDYRFDIKTHINFSKAQLSSTVLEKMWAQLVAYDFFEHYFEDGNNKHLDAAKRLLVPMRLPVPFQDPS